jgi:hypothetical protein
LGDCYFAQIIREEAHNFSGLLFPRLKLRIIYDKKVLGYILGAFSKTYLVTLMQSNFWQFPFPGKKWNAKRGSSCREKLKCNVRFETSWFPGADVIILIFLPKNRRKNGVFALNTACFCKHVIIIFGFWEKGQIFYRKLAKIGRKLRS